MKKRNFVDIISSFSAMQTILLKSATDQIQFDLDEDRVSAVDIFAVKTKEPILNEENDIVHHNGFAQKTLEIQLPEHLSLNLKALEVMRDILVDIFSDDEEHILYSQTNFPNGLSKEKCCDLAEAANFLGSKELLLYVLEAACYFSFNNVDPCQHFDISMKSIKLVQKYQHVFDDAMGDKRKETNRITRDSKSDLKQVCLTWVESFTGMYFPEYFDDEYNPGDPTLKVLFWNLLRHENVEVQRSLWNMAIECLYYNRGEPEIRWNGFHIPGCENEIPRIILKQEFLFVFEQRNLRSPDVERDDDIPENNCEPAGLLRMKEEDLFQFGYFRKDKFEWDSELFIRNGAYKLLGDRDYAIAEVFCFGRRPYQDTAFTSAFLEAVKFHDQPPTKKAKML